MGLKEIESEVVGCFNWLRIGTSGRLFGVHINPLELVRGCRR
jgi:hypothetical protein